MSYQPKFISAETLNNTGLPNCLFFMARWMIISCYFMRVQRIKNFCWAEKWGRTHLGWLWQPSAQEGNKNHPLPHWGVKQLQVPGWLHSPGSCRWEEGTAIGCKPDTPHCPGVHCSSLLSLCAYSHRNRTASACSLPGPYLPVFPALPESHSTPMHSQPLLFKVMQTRRLDSNLNCLHLSISIYKLGGKKKTKELAQFYI